MNRQTQGYPVNNKELIPQEESRMKGQATSSSGTEWTPHSFAWLCSYELISTACTSGSCGAHRQRTWSSSRAAFKLKLLSKSARRMPFWQTSSLCQGFHNHWKALGFSNNVAPDDSEMWLNLWDGRGVKDTQPIYCGYVKTEINSVILSIDGKIIPREYNNNPCKTVQGSYVSGGHPIVWSLRHVAAERLEN